MITKEGLADLLEYNDWADRRILDAAGALDPERFTRDLGSSFPSVRDTLVHVLSAEWIWLERWKGTSPGAMLDPRSFPELAAVRAAWQPVADERRAFLADQTEESLARVITYTNTRGERWAYPLRQMMQHVVNHSSYHRGQVVTMLRQLGAAVVATDYLLFADEEGRSEMSPRP